jgi:hypothetical protein
MLDVRLAGRARGDAPRLRASAKQSHRPVLLTSAVPAGRLSKGTPIDGVIGHLDSRTQFQSDKMAKDRYKLRRPS